MCNHCNVHTNPCCWLYCVQYGDSHVNPWGRCMGPMGSTDCIFYVSIYISCMYLDVDKANFRKCIYGYSKEAQLSENHGMCT